MATDGQLKFLFLISFSNVFCIGYCMNFDDIHENALKERQNDFEVNAATLKQQVIADSVEIKEWQVRVRNLETHMEVMKNERNHVLSRKKRALKDPKLYMFTGKRGAPGRPGKPGRPGRVGRRGEKGNKGVPGSPGYPGPAGSYGPPGWQGPPGFIGEHGIKGAKGNAGFNGAPGLIGDVGYVGHNGEPGLMGPQGFIGHIGFLGMTGPPGPRGEIGDVGISGPPGAKGSIGKHGQVGFYGEQGLMGEYGITGPPGEIGYKGAKGEIGMQGEIGTWGMVGLPGPVYDPYATMSAAPMMGKFAAGSPGDNCTDADGNIANCSDLLPMVPGLSYGKKALPILHHLPPGAHVMPAPKMYGKAPPGAYGPHMYSKQFHAAPQAPSVDFYDEDTDILNENAYNKLMEEENLRTNQNNSQTDVPGESETDLSDEGADIKNISGIESDLEIDELNDIDEADDSGETSSEESESNDSDEIDVESTDDSESSEEDADNSIHKELYSYEKFKDDDEDEVISANVTASS